MHCSCAKGFALQCCVITLSMTTHISPLQGCSQDCWKGVLKIFSAAVLATCACTYRSGWGRFCLPPTHTRKALWDNCTNNLADLEGALHSCCLLTPAIYGILLPAQRGMLKLPEPPPPPPSLVIPLLCLAPLYDPHD